MNFGRVGFVMEGDWSAAVTYDTLSVVLYEGAVYAAKRQSSGSEPSTHPADWLMWVGSPVISAEQTENGYDLTISNGDGTTSVVHLLNGQITEAELTTALSGLREAFNANIAEGYSSSSVYSEGDYCLYNNVLYRCKTDILSPEAWDPTHWEAASLADDVQDLSENLCTNKVDAITSNASGEIVTIADGGDDMPVVDLKLSLLPVQSGSGDPSPDNVRPISGWTGVEAYQSGKNMLSPNAIMTGYYINTNGIAVPYSGIGWLCTDFISVVGGEKYYFQPNTTAGGAAKHAYYDAEKNMIGYFDSGARLLDLPENARYVRLSMRSESTNMQLELGSTATAYEPYKGNTYPIDWTDEAGTVYGGSLDVTTGVLTVERVKKVFDGTESFTRTGGNNATTYFAYTLGALNSVKTPNNCICSAWLKTAITSSNTDVGFNVINSAGFNAAIASFRPDGVYVDGVRMTVAQFQQILADLYSAGTPCEVVYELATPTTYQLTPTQISTLLGTNNFWSNGNGTIDLEYRADTKLYIEQLTKPSEDDMTANKNITLGEFFMVGNYLYQASSAISTGETIAVGTNCTELSLADGLNLLKNS